MNYANIKKRKKREENSMSTTTWDGKERRNFYRVLLGKTQKKIDIIFESLLTREKWTMTITRIGVLSCCTLFTAFSASVPLIYGQINSSSVAVQQALTQQQVTTNSVEINSVQKEIELQRDTISQLRDEVSLQRGIGIGIASVIGLLQILQMLLQVKSVSVGNRRMEG